MLQRLIPCHANSTNMPKHVRAMFMFVHAQNSERFVETRFKHKVFLTVSQKVNNFTCCSTEPKKGKQKESYFSHPPHALSPVLVEEAQVLLDRQVRAPRTSLSVPGFFSFFSLVAVWHTARAILSGFSSWSHAQGHDENQTSRRTKQQTLTRQTHSYWARRTEN